jgi:ABC-type multidrug transport system fused ATPase/permease subunit
MKELLRLFGYARRYTGHLAASVVLMAVAGSGTGLMALLIGPLLYIVLDVHAAAGRVLLTKIPIPHHGISIYLDQIVPSFLHNVFSQMAFAVLAAFITKGFCDYCANYLVNYVGFSAVTNLRNRVFDKVVRQGAEFFESHSTGKLMSAIMNDAGGGDQQGLEVGADQPAAGSGGGLAGHQHRQADPPHHAAHAG